MHELDVGVIISVFGSAMVEITNKKVEYSHIGRSLCISVSSVPMFFLHECCNVEFLSTVGWQSIIKLRKSIKKVCQFESVVIWG